MHSSLVVKRCTRFWPQVLILILHLSCMHHIFTLHFNQLQYLHFLCHQVMLWMLFSSFYMSHFLPLFVKLLTFIVGFELTTRDDFLSVDSNTLPLCHGRLRTCIFICIFIFKFAFIFLNSEHYCILFNNTLYYLSPGIVHIVITY